MGVEARAVHEVDVPDGTYQAVWSGYVVTLLQGAVKIQVDHELPCTGCEIKVEVKDKKAIVRIRYGFETA